MRTIHRPAWVGHRASVVRHPGIDWHRVMVVAWWGAGYGVLLGLLYWAWVLAYAMTVGAQIAE
jgi:hypothetical protein